MTSETAHPHFPIEGRSPWVVLLPIMALGGLGTLAVFAFGLGLFEQGAFNANADAAMQWIVGGAAVFLVLEYLLVRFKLVPARYDYGRFRIYQHKVELYPLTRSGFYIDRHPQGIPLSDFRGVSIHAAQGKNSSAARFAVHLVHERRNRSLRVRIFTTIKDAEIYAQAFADAVRLPVLPWGSTHL